MKITKNGKIRIGIPEKIVEDLRTIYGNTTDINAKVEEILRNFIDARVALEPTLQPNLDAHSTDEDDDVFCGPMVFPGNPDPTGVLNPDEDCFFPVKWNGSHTMNINRAHAQVCFMLDAKDYPVLGRKLMNNILSVVEKYKQNIVEEWKL